MPGPWETLPAVRSTGPELASAVDTIRDLRPWRQRIKIGDRYARFSAAFDAVFTAIGVRIIKIPLRAPWVNAIAERWIASARRKCLDRMLITGERHLPLVLGECVDDYNSHRRHRTLQQDSPAGMAHPRLERSGMRSAPGPARRPDPRIHAGRMG